MNIDETAQMLGIISGVEPRFRLPDNLVTAMWHQIVKDVPLDVAMRAVAEYYGEIPDRVIMPADITRYARKERGANVLPYHRPMKDRIAEIDAEIDRENERFHSEVEPIDRDVARAALEQYKARRRG